MVKRYKSVSGAYITGGPKCKCGNRDWFLKGDSTYMCSSCERTRSAVHIGFVLNGPACKCGNRDWFVGESIVRCSYCDRSRSFR